MGEWVRVGQKMSVFVQAQGIKTVHAGGGGQKMANYVHVVVECPLTYIEHTHNIVNSTY